MQPTFRIRRTDPLLLSFVLCVGACNFDPNAPAAAGDGGDAVLPDAQVFDDGDLVPDATVLDAQPPNTACLEAPFVERPGFPHRYYAEGTDMNYDEAQASCMAAGAHLVVLNDPDEELFIESIAGAEPWIGLSDLDIEDIAKTGASFAWVNGESPTYTNWKGGEPSDGGGSEDCAILKGGKWEDKKCEETRESVCECDPATTVAAPPACMTNPAYTIIGGRRYRLDNTAATYANARASCTADGAHLVVVTDAAENGYVYSTDPGSPPWIGFDDLASPGNFTWVTGSANPYTRWEATEPSAGGDKNCVEMRADSSWYNNQCNLDRKFVCECDPLFLPSAL